MRGLKSALRRTRQRLRGPLLSDEDYHSPTSQEVDDIVIREAYLSEHLEDDHKPTTNEWLYSITRGLKHVSWNDEDFSFRIWGYYTVPMPTRGDVRALFRGLKIEEKPLTGSKSQE
jgi:hypothetical protein